MRKLLIISLLSILVHLSAMASSDDESNDNKVLNSANMSMDSVDNDENSSSSNMSVMSLDLNSSIDSLSPIKKNNNFKSKPSEDRERRHNPESRYAYDSQETVLNDSDEIEQADQLQPLDISADSNLSDYDNEQRRLNLYNANHSREEEDDLDNSLTQVNLSQDEEKDNTNAQVNSFTKFSDELIIHLFTFATKPEDLKTISFICKHWNYCAREALRINKPLWLQNRYGALANQLRGKDARVKITALKYSYGSQDFDHTNWINGNSNAFLYVSEKLRLNKFWTKTNTAIARISLIYSDETKSLQEEHYTIPYMFMSKWNPGNDEFVQANYNSKINEEIFDDFKCYGLGHSFVDDNHKKFLQNEDYKLEITNLLTNNTILSRDKIDLHRRQVISPQFNLFYLHSEQGLRYYLHYMTDVYIQEIVNRLQGKYKVHAVIHDIMSYNDMCSSCGDTYHVDFENDVLSNNLKEYFKSKSIDVDSFFKVFMSVVGFYSYPEPGFKFYTRTRENISVSNNHGCVDLLSYNKFIGQLYLNGDEK